LPANALQHVGQRLIAAVAVAICHPSVSCITAVTLALH